MARLPTRRSSPRLGAFDYTGAHVYFVTLATRGRSRRLVDAGLVSRMAALLHNSAERWCFHLLCYCFMPDHLHLVVQGATERSDLRNFIRAFKQSTGFLSHRGQASQLWQRSYYDHVLRPSESPRETVCYVLNNPVRKGLVEDWRQYRFSGGILKDALAGEEGGQT